MASKKFHELLPGSGRSAISPRQDATADVEMAMNGQNSCLNQPSRCLAGVFSLKTTEKSTSSAVRTRAPRWVCASRSTDTPNGRRVDAGEVWVAAERGRGQFAKRADEISPGPASGCGGAVQIAQKLPVILRLAQDTGSDRAQPVHRCRWQV